MSLSDPKYLSREPETFWLEAIGSSRMTLHRRKGLRRSGWNSRLLGLPKLSHSRAEGSTPVKI